VLGDVMTGVRTLDGRADEDGALLRRLQFDEVADRRRGRRENGVRVQGI
jgi:hypothetical protein